MRRHGVLFYVKLAAYGVSVYAAWRHDVLVMVFAAALATYIAYVD